MAEPLRYNEALGRPEDYIAIVRKRINEIQVEIDRAKNRGLPTVEWERQLAAANANLAELQKATGHTGLRTTVDGETIH